MKSNCTQNTDRECRPEDCCLKKCDHIIGLEHFHVELVHASDKDIYPVCEKFIFCPACGEKLV
jgi:hypothetical protein